MPSPLLPSQVKSKISAILERLTPSDLESPANRERFLADLPPWLFGTVGGNSPCVALNLDDSRGMFSHSGLSAPEELLVFDAGSGIRELGLAAGRLNPRPGSYRIFFSHFHWDHIMGLPFFTPAYDPAVKIDFYSPVREAEKILSAQMSSPYFPVKMSAMNSARKFHTVSGTVTVGGAAVSFKKMNHPGDSYAYKVDDGKHVFIHATDTELSTNDFIKNERNTAFFSNADVAVMDSQYTLGEAIEKYHWGHSAFSMAVDFAANWNIKHLVLFHHDPTYDDQKLYNNLQSAKWYMERMNIRGIEISLATEGMEMVI